MYAKITLTVWVDEDQLPTPAHAASSVVYSLEGRNVDKLQVIDWSSDEISRAEAHGLDEES